MGRTRKESRRNSTGKSPKKPMTSTERSRKRRLDLLKRDADNIKRQNARKLKAQNKPLSEEELEAKRKSARIRKAASRSNQTCQKEVGTRTKDRHRKRKALEGDADGEVSRNRVRKHRHSQV